MYPVSFDLERLRMLTCDISIVSIISIWRFQAPIHTKLVDADLLSTEERAWLNAYHAEVLEKVAPLLKNDERALRWLTKECQAI